jgi:serine/threonine protein kinase
LLNEILSTSIIPLFNIDQFKFLNAIGEGSYGKIYCIQNAISKSKYALKKIIAHDIKEIKRYQTEFELVYSHTHPNIMKIYNIQYKCLDFSTFSIYVLMELAICDWNADIKRKSEHKNPYKENELIILLSSLIKALSFLQRNNIAHRDIKPQNILLYPNTVIKVADFGEAKEIKLIKQQNTLKGTEMYMSPLLYNAVKYNKKNVEHNVYKSDVFSLGFCFLYAASLTFKIISDLREVKDMKEVRFKIGKYLNKKYSSKFINALIKMVEYNENERVDFIEMEKYIKENII